MFTRLIPTMEPARAVCDRARQRGEAGSTRAPAQAEPIGAPLRRRIEERDDPRLGMGVFSKHGNMAALASPRAPRR